MDTAGVLELVARTVHEDVNKSTNASATTDPTMLMGPCKVGTCPLEWSLIGYQPTVAGNAAYGVCFIILLLLQLFFGIRKRTWTYMSSVCLGIVGEIVGYGGRLLLHQDPFPMTNFLINLIPLTLAPALLTAGIYLCLSRIIVVVGAENSRIKPKMYTYIFIGCDMISLVIQAAGGAMAATASDAETAKPGVNIMIVGLVSQIVSMVIFFALWSDFAFRVRGAKASGQINSAALLYRDLRASRIFHWFQWTLFLAAIFIFIRCLYRVAELWAGFDGYLATHELTFMIFEGPMIIFALILMTAFHPGRVFDDLWVAAGKGYRFTKLGDGKSALKLHITKLDDWSENSV